MADDNKSPGTAPPGKLIKAGCGFRYAEDELADGIDFSGAQALKPEAADEAPAESEPSIEAGEHRQPDNHT
ncbi:MAG: hypothetical protein LAT63_07410 [Marinobacter sp.]|nr:hypothetical protein [Marinobacter sp.]